MATGYNDAVNYNAAIPYNGVTTPTPPAPSQSTSFASGGGGRVLEATRTVSPNRKDEKEPLVSYMPFILSAMILLDDD